MQYIEISSADELWAWLEANHAQNDSIRLVTWKVGHPDKYVSREEVLDALIAYGWIDGQRFKVDDDQTAQLIAPRKQQAWSQSYKERVEKLRREGRMKSAGEQSVQNGQKSGLWDFFSDVDALIVPDDLAAVINLESWNDFAPSYRRNVLRWIKVAKTEATRKKRVSTVVEATEKKQKIPQF